MYYIIKVTIMDAPIYWSYAGWHGDIIFATRFSTYNPALYRCKRLNARRTYGALCEVITCNSGNS